MAPMIKSTVISSTTAVAAAEGYCNSPMSFEISLPTFASWLPDMNRVVTKSLITRAITKIDPIMTPGFDNGMITLVRI